MQYFLLAVAVLLIAVEFVATRSNRRAHIESAVKGAWSVVYRRRWVIGIPFALASCLVSYPYPAETETYRVLGFPLPAAAFNEAGHDYVSILTIPIFIADALIWYFIPQIILFFWAIVVRRKRAADA